MQNLAVSQRHDEQEEEDPIVRVIYALGVALLVAGPVLPNGGKWAMLGVAMITFSTML